MSRKCAAVILTTAVALVLVVAPASAQERPPTQAPTQEGNVPGATPPVTQAAPPGHVYFYLGGEPAPVERDITGGGQMIEFAVLELLKGPTEEEKAAGYTTYIPEGTKLQYTTIKQDRSEFSLNLSRELLALEAGSEAAARALTQIVRTVQDVSGIRNVGVTAAADAMGGQPVDAFEALGIPRGEITGVESGGGSSGGKSRTGLVLGIVFGSLGALVLVALLVLAAVKRRGAGDKGGGKEGAGASARKPPRKKGL